MMKSGSTLAFALAKGILVDNGYVQERLPDDVVAPAGINFLRGRLIGRRQVEQLLSFEASCPRISVESHSFALAGLLPHHRVDAVPGPQFIAVKTHSPLDPRFADSLEKLIEDRRLLVHVIYRDPRDICLSLLDAGAWARRTGRPQFSGIVTLEDAIESVRRQLESLRIWGGITGASLYGYHEVAFEMDKTIERMERDLRLTSNRDALKHYVSSVFTQKNKAKRSRHLDEMTPEENEKCLGVFGSFIDEVIVRKNLAWFSDDSAPSRPITAVPAMPRRGQTV